MDDLACGPRSCDSSSRILIHCTGSFQIIFSNQKSFSGATLGDVGGLKSRFI